MSKMSLSPLLLFLLLTGCIRNPPETFQLPLSYWDHRHLESSLGGRDVLMTSTEGDSLSGHLQSLSPTEAVLVDTLGSVYATPLSPSISLEFVSAGRGFRLGFGRGFWGGFALGCLLAGDSASGWIISVGLAGGTVGSLLGAGLGGTARFQFSLPADTVPGKY